MGLDLSKYQNRFSLRHKIQRALWGVVWTLLFWRQNWERVAGLSHVPYLGTLEFGDRGICLFEF